MSEPVALLFTYFTDPKSRRQIVCHFCTAEDHNVSCQQLKDLLASKTILLIDVREKPEIAEHGKIPGSINIPCKLLLGDLEQGKSKSPSHCIQGGKTWNYLMYGIFCTWICAAGQLFIIQRSQRGTTKGATKHTSPHRSCHLCTCVQNWDTNRKGQDLHCDVTMCVYACAIVAHGIPT